MSPQRLNPEEVFEDRYTAAFKQRFDGLGLGISYDRDRAARDVGFQLTAPGSLELSNVRVWFQLKGVHTSTLSATEIELIDDVPVDLSVDDVKKWYAAPEAVYIVLYLEALDEFVAQDVRDLVDKRFSDHHGDFPSKMASLGTSRMTLRVDKRAVFNADRIEGLLTHRSMRIDGPTWRGRPLGHQFDPLRCELGVLEPALFVQLVEALLTAHDFRIEDRLDAAELLAGVRDGTDEADLCVGTMHSAYEWPFTLGTEFGQGPDSDFREEGELLSVQGPTAILVHSKFGDHASPSDGCEAILESVRARGIPRVLTIANAPETLLLASYRSVLGDLFEFPQGQGGLAYSVLVAPLVFMEFQNRLRWKFVNYLWDDPQRPAVKLRP